MAPTYLQPKSVEEAACMLGAYDELRIMAGGTDLLVAIRDGLPCKYIMDIKCIPEMKSVGKTDAGLSVGGAVPLNKLLDSEFVTGCYSVLRDAGLQMANYLLRNRATLIGNICNASPGGDMLGASLVLNGYLEAASLQGIRKIPLNGFFKGVKKHALRKDELAVRVVFPQSEGRGIYLKKRRIRGHDLAQIGLTAFRHKNGGLDIAIGAAAPTPILLKEVIRAGERPNAEKVIDAVLGSISPIADVRSSREYRIAIVKYFIRQSIGILFDGESEAV